MSTVTLCNINQQASPDDAGILSKTPSGARSFDPHKISKHQFAADILHAASEINKSISSYRVSQSLHSLVLTSNAFLLIAAMFLPFDGLAGFIASITLAIYITSRWTIIQHHISHRAFDSLHDDHYHSGTFAQGSLWQRLADWPDWIYPEAWALEHNKNHHCHLNEYADFDHSDPDFVEMNMSGIINFKLDLAVLRYVETLLHIFTGFGGIDLNDVFTTIVKDIFLIISMLTWRWMYYACNTYDRYKTLSTLSKQEREKLQADRTITLFTSAPIFAWITGSTCSQLTFNAYWEMFSVTIFPLVGYCVTIALSYHYLLVPLFLHHFTYWSSCSNPHTENTFTTVLWNILIGETLANVYSFAIVVPNHCGNDLYKFPQPACGQVDIIFRSVLGSTNFQLGGYWTDFFHGYLNYQIEHHMFPDMSPLHYRLFAPKVQVICIKYGIPYVQESVFHRLFRTRQIIQGKEQMMIYYDEIDMVKGKQLH